MRYSTPLYIQLYDSLLEKIKSGVFIPGQMLDAERTMAKEYDVNRETVKKALTLLEKDGYITRVQGKGTFVSNNSNSVINFETSPMNTMINTGITAKLKRSGTKSSNKIIAKEIRSGLKRAAKKLRIHLNDDIFVLYRIRYGNDKPISIEYVYSPMDIMDDSLLDLDFEKVSFYDYLNKLNHLPVNFRRVFKVVRCSEKEAQLLQIKSLSPVYLFEDVARDEYGRVIEYVRTYIRTDMIKISFNAYSSDQ